MPPFRTNASHARRRPARTPWRLVVAVLTAWSVLAIGLAARSPQAHEHVHHDAGHPEHVCAITLAAAGFCDTAAPAIAIAPAAPLPTHFPLAPGSFRWTAPDHWLTPALAPPSRAA